MPKNLKIVNYRPIFLAFLSVMIGIFIGYLIFDNLLFLLLSLGITVSVFVLGITTKLYKSFKKIICVLTLFLVIGISLSYIHQAVYYSEKLEGEITIIGRATEQIYDTTGGKGVILSGLELESGKFINSKLSLTIYGDLEDTENEIGIISPGDYIKFKAKITTQSINIFKKIPKVDGIVLGGVKYYAVTSSENIIIESGKANFFENIKVNAKNNIFEYVKDSNISGFVYATIFGDNNYLSDGINNNFKTVGVSHLISVSGLHVGFLAVIILFICKLLKLKKKPIFFITAFVLLIYVFLCGFSASVVRSAVMFTVMLFAGLIGKRNDPLSTLSLSGIIILLISPFSMFSLGFILSFGCMFSLMFLTEPVSKLLYKLFNVKENKILLALASSLAVNLGLLCLQIYFFNSFTPVAIVANLILIPLFSVGFTVSIVFTLLGLIFSPLAYMLVVSEVVYTGLIKIVESLSVLGVITVNNPFWLCVIWAVFIFGFSNYTFIKNKLKIIMAAVAIITVIVTSVFYTLPITPKVNSVIKLSQGNILTAKSGYACIIIENFDEKELAKLIEEAKYRRLSIDTIILARDTNAGFEYFVRNNPELNFICFRTSEDGLLPNLTNLKVIKSDQYLEVGEVEFRGFYVSGSLAAVDIKFENNKRVAVIPNLNSAKISFIEAHEYLKTADNFLIYRVTKAMDNLLLETDKVYISKESNYGTQFSNVLNENREEFIIRF